MKAHLAIGFITASLLFAGLPSTASARDITAPELASFLGISSWETRVALPPDSYTVDICAIEDGKVGPGLLGDGIDWSKDPDGRLVIMAGPADGNYRLSIANKASGSLGVTTSVPVFEASHSPSLPETVSEGEYILFVDLVDRDTNGAEDSPATYQRGFLLRVTKKN